MVCVVFLFVVLAAVNCVKAEEDAFCQTVVMLDQVKTDTQDAIASMQDKINEVSRKTEIMEKNTDTQDAITTLQNEVVTLQEEIQSMRNQTGALEKKNDTHDVIVSLQKELVSMNKTIQEIINNTGAVENEKYVIASLRGEVVSLQEEMRNTTEALKKKNEQLEQTLQHVAGFSVRGVKSIYSWTITFSEIITNVDNSYGETNGIFSCKIPGYYYFSASLVKAHDWNLASIYYITKNGVWLVAAVTLPGDDSQHKGQTVAVASVYIHLRAGDGVSLRGTTTNFAQWLTGTTYSSFSGFLITPDL